jgi:hypothetical protein
MSFGFGPHDYDCQCARCEARRSRTRCVQGDAHLTAFINADDFLEDEDLIEEDIAELPDEGQCQ